MLAVACGGDDSTTDQGSEDSSAPSDGGHDASVDTARDISVERGPDATAERAPDAIVEREPDGAVGTPPDGATDAALETTIDTGSGSADGASDAVDGQSAADRGSDAPASTNPDASSDGPGDVVAEATQDVASDASAESSLDGSDASTDRGQTDSAEASVDAVSNCTPDGALCFNDQLQICDADGGSVTISCVPQTCVNGACIPATGLVGAWLMDDAVGAQVAVDSSVPPNDAGLGNNAICGMDQDFGGGTALADCPTFGVAGSANTAASFDGSDDWMGIPNVIPDTFTISAWINTTDTGPGSGGEAFEGDGIIWSDVGGPGPDMVPMALVGTQIAFGTGEQNGGSYDTTTSATSVNTGQWVHVVVTRDSSTGDKQIYIDGVLDASSTGSTGTLDFNPVIAFGANPLDGRYFPGQIDDVYFYNRVLSAAEVTALFRAK